MIGVIVSASAATSPAVVPKRRATMRQRTSTVSRPASACGSSTVQEPNPKSRARIAEGQKASGGLSTVMKLPGSSDAKRNAFQLCAIDLIAAA